MKKALVALCLASCATGLFAQSHNELNTPSRKVYFPSRNMVSTTANKAGQNLTYYGGPIIQNAHAVYIFWGPSFSDAASPDFTYAQTLIAYRNQFGTTPEYNTITQYSQTGGIFIQLTNLAGGTADFFDTTTPPTNVTDATVRSEVTKYLQTHAFDASAVYQVFIPSTSYSSSGSRTSCGGPSLGYCAYHSYFNVTGGVAKYAIQPYASCGGCSVSGWTAAQNQEHFACHELREAVTDPQISAWLDRAGNEADDKCAWSPSPFIGTGGFAYQYEWSNAAKACVKTR